MLLDITFFDDAVPTSSVSQPSGAEAAAAALAGAEDEDEEHGKDVTDWASMIGRLKVKLTRAIPYRYIVHRLALILLVVQQVEHWTCDQQVVGSNPTRGKSCIKTSGKLFTPMCLCHQAV